MDFLFFILGLLLLVSALADALWLNHGAGITEQVWYRRRHRA